MAQITRRKITGVTKTTKLGCLSARNLHDMEQGEPFVEGVREQFNQPTMYEEFEYLYNQIRKREKRLRPT